MNQTQPVRKQWASLMLVATNRLHGHRLTVKLLWCPHVPDPRWVPWSPDTPPCSLPGTGSGINLMLIKELLEISRTKHIRSTFFSVRKGY